MSMVVAVTENVPRLRGRLAVWLPRSVQVFALAHTEAYSEMTATDHTAWRSRKRSNGFLGNKY